MKDARMSATPTQAEQDAEIASLRRRHSLRAIARLYGFKSHNSVAWAIRRHEKRTGEKVATPARAHALRPSSGSWLARLLPLMKRPMVWQDALEMDTHVAQATVTRLRRSSLSAFEGGEWEFRSRGVAGEPQHCSICTLKAKGRERRHAPRAVVQARWNGTRCTNCGALSPASPCPLCGYDKEAE